MHATDSKIEGICEAYIHNKYLYLGSPWADNLARVPMEQAMPNFIENTQSSVIDASQSEVVHIIEKETTSSSSVDFEDNLDDVDENSGNNAEN